MAGAKMSAVRLKPIEVHLSLQEGEKFIKWDEESGGGTPVTLRVDSHGFYLYWMDQNKETDMLDVGTIRDARTGKFAKIPKDPKLRQIVTMGSQDTLEEKTVTICYGFDFVNLSYINFCCTKRKLHRSVDERNREADKKMRGSNIMKLWIDEILLLAYNLWQLNSSPMNFLQKAHTKLLLTIDKAGKIPVKNITKLFAQNKEDRKRVEKALDVSGFPSGKSDALSVQKFQFEDFFNFYKCLAQRSEVEKVFEELCGTSRRRLMSASQFVEFLNKTQRDPRLNEILYPYANTTRAKDLIQQYEPNKYNAQKGQLSFDGFLRYLMSDDNPIMSPSMFDLSDDMDQPLAHYFINSSHNTYLTGHQLTGKSSVEMYRQCLLAGCRCIELDFWNGRTEEPVIVHGYTFVPEISAKEVIEAIAETAFKTSDYPVILSFENHCNPRQQAKIAQYCREIFGEMLLDVPLESHKLEPGSPLPPPSLLKRKIMIKNKKKHHHKHQSTGEVQGNGDVPHHPPLQARQGSKDSQHEDEENEEEEESSSGVEEGEEEDLKTMMQEKPNADKVAKARESEAGAEISALVNYIQPVHFSSFENSEKKNRFYEMSSFDEKQATQLLKERPIEFVNYNKHQLSRVYPAGTRFDSSNFMPQVFWNAGCQLAALNYQTLDLAMQLNLGIFEYNLRCGYLLKPEFMRRRDRRLDPFAESTVDGIIAGTVSVQVISAQFLTDKRVGTYIEVDMYGLPADTVRRKFRTKIIPNNGINPVYMEDPFVFKKVVLPELACLRVSAYEESGRFIGHRVLPVVGLCPGYRHVGLKTESGQPLPLASIFVQVVVKDYVPDGLSELAEALANPIKYQSELEKRTQQLAVLTDDLDTIDSSAEDPNAKPPTKKQMSVGTEVVSTNHTPPSAATTSHRPSVTVLSPDVELVPSDPEQESNISPQLGGATIDASQALNKSPQVNAITSDTEEIAAESLEKLMEYKVVKEKRLELEKKLETLRKKHEKERVRFQSQRSQPESEKQKSKFKLMKRISSKNMDSSLVAVSDVPVECLESEGEVKRVGLPRSQSERLLAVWKDHMTQERELEEKHQEIIFSTVEKVMKTSQASQMKLIRALLERETEEVMKNLQSLRREEVKNLSKVHRDKDELIRMKREVASAMVERGVVERVRLTQVYERRREKLERQHEEVRHSLEEARAKAREDIIREYENRSTKMEKELQPSSDCATGTGTTDVNVTQ